MKPTGTSINVLGRYVTDCRGLHMPHNALEAIINHR